MLAWEAAGIADGGGTVSAGRKTLVNNPIAGLKTDGPSPSWIRLGIFLPECDKPPLGQ